MKNRIIVCLMLTLSSVFFSCKNDNVGQDCPPQIEYISSALLPQNVKTYVNAYYGSYKLSSSEKKTYCDNYFEYIVYLSGETSNATLLFGPNGNFIKSI